MDIFFFDKAAHDETDINTEIFCEYFKYQKSYIFVKRFVKYP